MRTADAGDRRPDALAQPEYYAPAGQAPEGGELLARLDVVVEAQFKRFPPTTRAEMRTLLEVLDRIREHMAVKTVAELIR